MENISFVGPWIPVFGLLAMEASAMETPRVEARAQTRIQSGKFMSSFHIKKKNN